MKNDRAKNIILSSNIFVNSKPKQDTHITSNNSSTSQTKKTGSSVFDTNSFRFKEVGFKFKTGKNSRI